MSVVQVLKVGKSTLAVWLTSPTFRTSTVMMTMVLSEDVDGLLQATPLWRWRLVVDKELGFRRRF
ncbi:hypothetical protein M8C21_011049 [Ambrosia artemisiifolia]|uniref:Uncharacterized protein n=1 Tax=Ambrosia artemisiifolia TaxID=4212 RepID=A0AAD5CR69_AMBAR|nr:hypothetical protein M8C21_011049 [Ambrosia artemisiifolia]